MRRHATETPGCLLVFAVALVSVGLPTPASAQPPPGPRTLADLLDAEAKVLPEGVLTKRQRGPVPQAIMQAWQAYEQEVGEASASLRASLEAELRRARDRRDKDAESGLQAAVAAFVHQGQLPSALAPSLAGRRDTARKAYAQAATRLGDRYAAAERELRDDGRQDEADDVAAGWKLLADQLAQRDEPQPDSVWQHSIAGGQSAEITLYSNGTIDAPDGPDTWTLKGTSLVIRWKNPEAPGGAWIDRCQVSPYGGSYSGANQLGTRITGRRVSAAAADNP